MMNGVSGSDSDGYNHWSEMKPAQPKSLSPPQPQKQLSDSYSNTLPVRKNVAPKNSYASGEAPALLRGPGASSATGEVWGMRWGWTLGCCSAGTVTNSIPSLSSAAGASWRWEMLELGSALRFHRISSRKTLWNLAQGTCALCHGCWVMLKVWSCLLGGKV